MTFWTIMALMTAAAIFAVLWPLSRRNRIRGGSDIEVYRDQLDEIERDRAAGLIGEPEAIAARTEVSRRLIAAGDAAPPVEHPVEMSGGTIATGAPLWRRRATALAALVLLPIGAAALYLSVGAPMLPGQPHAERTARPPDQNSLAEMIARVEQRLEQHPEDGTGWEVIAPVYMRLGRFEDAVKARQNALRLLGPTAAREADLGEALTGLANGIVSAEAKAAFERAVALDASDFKARYFLGLALEQDGRPKEAAAAWRSLLAQAPPGAPWAAFVREQLARVEPGVAPPPGPSAEDVATASEMPADQRAAMIAGMVERLADRLKREGSDVEGWLRLMRAYMVLGDRDKARAAAGDARRALASEPDKVRQVEELAKGLGLEG